MSQHRHAVVLVAACLLLSACGSGAADTLAPTGLPAQTTTPTASLAASPLATASAPLAPPSNAPTAGPAAAACDHRYWPIRTGAMWTTGNGSGGTIQLTITGVVDGADGATATQRSVTNVSTIDQQLHCTAAGIQLGDATFDLQNGHTGTRTMISAEGALLPADDAIVDGATFSYSTRANLDFPAFDSSGKYTGQVKYELDQSFDCTVAGPMSVTVTAGQFTGVEVTCNGTSTRIDSDGTTTPTDLNNVQTYYLDGVGPSGVAPGSQLVSYSIPGS
jgi:hypothetical protein